MEGFFHHEGGQETVIRMCFVDVLLERIGISGAIRWLEGGGLPDSLNLRIPEMLWCERRV